MQQAEQSGRSRPRCFPEQDIRFAFEEGGLIFAVSRPDVERSGIPQWTGETKCSCNNYACVDFQSMTGGEYQASNRDSPWRAEPRLLASQGFLLWVCLKMKLCVLHFDCTSLVYDASRSEWHRVLFFNAAV